MFITYWFILFASVFFPVYWFSKNPSFRKLWLLVACLIFHYRFAGPAGVVPIICLGTLTYVAGVSNKKTLRIITIMLCVLALVFYKYTTFIITQVIGIFSAEYATFLLKTANQSILPEVPPLAISFFVFEFVHYLMDINRGKNPISSPVDFTLFSVFWPSVVSGPVKRFEQFIPSIAQGCRQVNSIDIQVGIMRITTGLVKKLLIADNLTGFIAFWQPQFDVVSLKRRWLILVAISLRILFDFSGYSDIAIGFARLMGIKLPENFNWPYLATNLQAFWHRWHISLSTWIRDYIYIPLGGNKKGPTRKLLNGIIAFGVCGLWHGAAMNFIFWGLFHGVGLVIVNAMKPILNKNIFLSKNALVIRPFSWLLTYVYVSIGWLYFFFPIKEATHMLELLVKK